VSTSTVKKEEESATHLLKKDAVLLLEVVDDGLRPSRCVCVNPASLPLA
jgi:hypothetical protein